MNLYKLRQTENTGWDTYDSCVVVAENEEEAKKIHPAELYDEGGWELDSWASKPENVQVMLIGTAVEDIAEGTVVCSSFNAG